MKFLSIMTEIVSLQNDSVVAFIKIAVLMFLLTVKTSILLVIVMFLGFLSRPELVISYLPPGMASKINTKGKRLYILCYTSV